MKPFTPLTSKIIPLPIQNVDTDMIIPAQFLTSTSREGYGENLFRRLRDHDKEFPLVLPRYQHCSVLLTEENFGCGSSREHAVWALLGAGIRAIIGISFADIFAGNAAKNGLLLITLPHEILHPLFRLAKTEDIEVTINLEKQTVALPSGALHYFDYPPFRKHCLLEGKDDFDYLLEARSKIEEHQQNNPSLKFLPNFTALFSSKELP